MKYITDFLNHTFIRAKNVFLKSANVNPRVANRLTKGFKRKAQIRSEIMDFFAHLCVHVFYHLIGGILTVFYSLLVMNSIILLHPQFWLQFFWGSIIWITGKCGYLSPYPHNHDLGFIPEPWNRRCVGATR